MTATSTEAIRIAPLDAPLGAEIRGLDAARPLAPDALEAVVGAWRRHLVLLLRDQSLDDDALLGFSRQLGELDPPGPNPYGAPFLADYPDINVISNVVEDGKPIGSLGAGEAEWHTDMSYLETPPTASLLYAREIPPSGGNTCFADMAAALDALPDALRGVIEGRTAKHNASYTSAGELRRDAEAVHDPSTAPGVSHPIVRTHPESGRKSIFLGRRRHGYIEGLELEESERVLDDIWAFCSRPEFHYEHAWRVGDLLIWDNRAMIHRREAFDPTSRRVMLRAQVKGDRPR